MNISPGEIKYSLWRARVWITSPGEQGHSLGRAKNRWLRELDIFHPKIPICNFPMPKFDSKSCLIVSKHEKALETI